MSFVKLRDESEEWIKSRLEETGRKKIIRSDKIWNGLIWWFELQQVAADSWTGTLVPFVLIRSNRMNIFRVFAHHFIIIQLVCCDKRVFAIVLFYDWQWCMLHTRFKLVKTHNNNLKNKPTQAKQSHSIFNWLATRTYCFCIYYWLLFVSYLAWKLVFLYR